jgi:Glycosyltransferase family 87
VSDAAGASRLPYAPTTGQLFSIGIAALLIRLTVFVTLTVGSGFSFKTYTDAADGKSYQVYARAILGDPSQWTQYDKRVFPGYPLLIAAAHELSGLGIAASALVIAWISSALAAIFSAILFHDRRVGWAMVTLIPHWPINSSLIMGEAPMLALALAGLILGLRNRPLPSGLALGTAILVRPVACFPLAGLLLTLWIGRKHRQAVIAALSSAAAAVVGLMIVNQFTGEAWHGAKIYADSPSAYGGQIFAWPFQALIQTPLQVHVPPARLFYVWAHVVLALSACVILALTARRFPLRFTAMVWVLGNTLFTLCIGTGPYGWGFYHFPRFTIPATPAIIWAVSAPLPSRTWIWILVTILMYAFTIAGVHQALTSGPPPRVF